ncbi:MAG: bla regulator protein blaR1 [Sphingomonadales bacterium]|jgi:beta-lactamase regulating signal transducer with metallopeptidase domain|nr:bla regulator protein blaR1 [Sphingomonadales bacterium]
MIAWLIETSVAVTLLMVMVLLLRGPVARSFGAGWAYALWAVPALRLVLPPLAQLAPDLRLPPVVLFIPTAAEMAAPLPAQAGPGQWVPFMLAMWAGGAVIFLTLQWLGYRTFLGRIRDSSRPARPPLFGGIRTWISEAVEGPLALGVIERRIVLPGDFSRRYNPVERRLALEHELVHHKRGDIWWNLVATFILALFWFNPVAWLAFRAFRSDQELACDAAVARSASLDERCEYARALVKSASRPGLIAACALNPAGELKRRLRMMRNHRSSPLRSAGGVVALAAFAMAGFALGSAGKPPAAQAARRHASVAAWAASPAPLRLAAAANPRPAVLAAARHRARAVSARARLAVEPMSFASAQAPTTRLSTLTSMVTMLRGLPRSAIAPRALPSLQRMLASTVAVPSLPEGRMVKIIRTVHAEAQVFTVSQVLSEEEAAELRQAVAEAVADGREVRLKVQSDASDSPAGGGGQGKGFDINIQTLERGE